MVKQIKYIINNDNGAETLEYIIITAIIIIFGSTAYNDSLTPIIQSALTRLSTAIVAAIG